MSLVQIGYIPPTRYDVDCQANTSVQEDPELLPSHTFPPNGPHNATDRGISVASQNFNIDGPDVEDQWYNLLVAGSAEGHELGGEGFESLSLFMPMLTDYY